MESPPPCQISLIKPTGAKIRKTVKRKWNVLRADILRQKRRDAISFAFIIARYQKKQKKKS